MMNRKEFEQYLQDNVKDYLPESFTDAKVTFNEVVKNNDTHLTGISIARDGDTVVPNIYIDSLFDQYLDGKDIDEIVGDIADARIEYDAPSIDVSVAESISNYDNAKDKLQIRLCDTKENQDRLKNLVHTEHSDFSATYHVVLADGRAGMASTPVTHQLLDTWGISVEQLHADALKADMARDPVLCDLNDMMTSMMFGSEPDNLIGSSYNSYEPGTMAIFCLTNGDKVEGAGLILQDEIMQQIGDMIGGNFYILPSSTHEVLIVPEAAGMELKELSAMVQQVNATEVSDQDKLSDEVQFYDKDAAVMENAEKRASRLEMAKGEKTVAKSKRSIHDRLGENKQKSAAQKAGKTAEKAVKKEKGTEL